MQQGILQVKGVDPAPYLESFNRYSDELSLLTSDMPHDPEQITFALLWYPDDDIFDRYPNVKLVASIAAGVDNILACPSLRDDVIVCRNRDPEQASIMSTFALWHIIGHQRNFERYREQQAQHIWKRHPMRAPADINVGILGLGFMGEKIADDCHALGFNVAGWRKSFKTLTNEEIPVFAGTEQLDSFLQRTEVLICVLPLTDETRGILNRDTFSKLQRGGYLVHIGRGDHLVPEDLFAALEDGQLAGAALDVFTPEPLPADSPIWDHPKIFVTPHDASDVRPSAAAANLAEEVERFVRGEAPANQVLKEIGY
ncbi:2-hydroxyacid dehydrogenase [Marinobacterium mangrovicola]|uniref:Glyoxylate/hydroxypyruvate reductase A n=1 Tax=Marinobacterium mangrovicola TaxID=1476959 RepID=A0A4R1G9Y2_9GAMM|nr:glyoxylate/hydroxypyruvate reductase A [Marinobacterium mangrovicola]TCK04764.1 glyoxylate/hydroxypyruvate reductase A [Marinobacterium mangrovicola]